MPPRDPPENSSPLGALAAVGIAAVAVLCCAAVPVLAALAGSVAIGTVLGVGAGLAVAVLAIIAVVPHARRRHAWEPPGRGPEREEPDAPQAPSRERTR